MITLKTNTTFGNFAIVAEAEVSEAQLGVLANAGLLQILQRSPATAAEKLLAKYDKRPAGFQRNSIPFSEANAIILADELQKPIEIGENGSKSKVNATVIVTEHVPNASEVKFAAERAKYASKNGDAEKLAKLAEAVGYKGEVGSGKADEAPVEFLAAIKEWVAVQFKALGE